MCLVLSQSLKTASVNLYEQIGVSNLILYANLSEAHLCHFH